MKSSGSVCGPTPTSVIFLVEAARDEKSAVPDRDHAIAVAPAAKRDHVLKLGAIIQVYAAQDHYVATRTAKHARPAFASEQRSHGWLGEAAFILQPLARGIGGRIQVDPEQTVIGAPRFSLRLAYGFGSTALSHGTGDKQSVFRVHHRALPHSSLPTFSRRA